MEVFISLADGYKFPVLEYVNTSRRKTEMREIEFFSFVGESYEYVNTGWMSLTIFFFSFKNKS